MKHCLMRLEEKQIWVRLIEKGKQAEMDKDGKNRDDGKLK